MTTNVQSVIDALGALENDENGVEPIAKAFLDGDEFVLQMNESAAIHLCRLILETASKSIAGAHQHLDDTNFVDAGGGRLRIENVR
ncbi:MAG: hypothetical protein ACT6Q7_01595 [Blastomonas fulva]|jgi:hypothetical protein|uniref:hypothetical protein n=1 Tax=Blastomonas TaxID=150203 RepID=UPI00258FFC0C|nr:hypothetical protein [Blastomonas sp.]